MTTVRYDADAEAEAVPLTLVELDERGRLRTPGPEGGVPVPADRVAEHLARELRVPEWATDIYVYVHGWRTTPRSARRTVSRLLGEARRRAAARPELYGGLAGGFRPWCVVVSWPSVSMPSLAGYRRIRDRAHAMSAPGTGQAAYVLGHLLGYLDAHRADPAAPRVLATRGGQYLHLVGHSFGGRFLCEAMQWAAERPGAPRVLGWSVPGDPRRPFTVDSALIFQMAAPRDCFSRVFPALFVSDAGPAAPLGGPLVLTYSRWDRATGFWHLRAESAAGIGHSGAGAAPVPQFGTRLHAADEPYGRGTLDHRLVNVDAGWRFRGPGTRRLAPAGAHSDFVHAESAHLMLSLSALSR